MKRSSSNTAKSKSVLAKRTPAPSRPGARKTSKSSASKTQAKAASPMQRKRAAVPAKPTAPETSQSKQSQLISLMGTESGASVAQLTTLTGWQPHTVRGVISGSLRKRLGLNVQCLVEEGVRVYRIVEAPAP